MAAQTYNPAAHLELDVPQHLPAALVAAAIVAAHPADGGHSFTTGTPITAAGAAHLEARRPRVKVAHLRPAADVLGEFARLIEGEHRREVRGLTLRGVRASPDGRMLAFGKPGADAPIVVGTPTRKAWAHLADRLDAHTPDGAPGLRAYLPDSPLMARETIVYAHAGLVSDGAQVSVGMRDADEMMRVSGPRYAALDPDRIARRIMAYLPAGWRAEVSYDRSAWSLRMLDPTPIKFAAAKVGDGFARGMIVRGNDVREGCATVATLMERLMCSNGAVAIVEDVRGRRVHVGAKALADVESMVADCLTQMDRRTGEFGAAWADATQAPAFTGDASKAFGVLLDRGMLDVPGKRDDNVSALMHAWNVEPGNMRADVVNAITRAAHEHAPWYADIDMTADIERQASALLYNRRVVLA